jgi:hypothetical protein
MTNNGAKIKYLLDTNVLIEFSVWKPISLNLNKDFWTGFETALRKNDWILLDVVAGEVKYDNDLIGWINNQKKNGIG